MSQQRAGWAVLDEHIYEQFGIFSIGKSKRVNPRTGNPFEFFRMDGLDWVNVIAITEQNEVVFVEQFRHGSNTYTLELPGGCVDPGESPAHSAQRELLEETGYSATTLQHLGTLYPNPAMQSMQLHCYLTHPVAPLTSPRLDPGEDISVRLIPLPEVWAAVRDQRINHALVVAPLTLLALHSPSAFSPK